MNHLQRIADTLGEIDAVLLTSEANCFYATGFRGEGAVLVSRYGCRYFTDSRYTEAAEMTIIGAAVEECSANHKMIDAVNEMLLAGDCHTVAIEEAYMTVNTFDAFEKKLCARPVKCASALLNALRARKDEEELAAMISAQRIAESALTVVLEWLHPGLTEQEVGARLQYEMLLRGAQRMSFNPIIASGAKGSMPHAVPTEKKLAAGEFVTMDFGCVYGGYCSDMTRTVCLGQPTEEMRRVYDIVLQAQLAGIEVARAGVSGQQIDGVARKVIGDAGYGVYFGHGFGHSLGVEIHEAPNANAINDKPMPCGAVISAEPGIYLPGRFGVRIEDVIVIGEDGSRNITLAPKELLCL